MTLSVKNFQKIEQILVSIKRELEGGIGHVVNGKIIISAELAVCDGGIRDTEIKVNKSTKVK